MPPYKNKKEFYSKIPQEEIIKEYEKGMGCHRIALKYGYSKSFILNFIKGHNVNRRHGSEALHRKYIINQKFFKSIDSEEKAYFLGLICSDGCNHKRGVIDISLTLKDKEILEKLSKFIFLNNRPLLKIKARIYKDKKGRVIHVKESRRLLICSKFVSKQLSEIGIMERKTWNLKFPSLQEKLKRPFILGYFDGDGGLTITRRENRFITGLSIIGTLNVCENIKDYFKNKDINCLIIHRKSDPKEVFCLYISGSRQIIKALNCLYKDACIFMKRKFLLYKKLIKLRSARYMSCLFKAKSPEGKEFTRFFPTKFAQKNNLNPTKVLECLRKVRTGHKGWTFTKVLNKRPIKMTGLHNAVSRLY